MHKYYSDSLDYPQILSQDEVFERIIWNYQKIFLSLQKETNIMYMTTQEMIQQIAEYFKTQPVLKAWLFGSYSRGEQREGSDVDILILVDRSQPVGLFKLSGMHGRKMI